MGLEKTYRGRRPQVFGPLLLDEKNLSDDVKTFRNIHLVTRKVPIQSILEADQILENNPSDPNALRYRGWYLLQIPNRKRSTIEAAITCLVDSAIYGNKAFLVRNH